MTTTAAPSAPAASSAPASKPAAAKAASAGAASGTPKTKAPTIAGTGDGNAGGSDAGLRSAVRGFLRPGSSSGKAADTATPTVPDNGSPEAAGDTEGGEGGETEGNEGDTQGQANPAEAVDDTEPTAKAYDYGETADAAAPEGEAQESEGGEADPALSAIESIFNLKPGTATADLKAGMISDVEAVLAQAKKGQSDTAGSTPPASDNQARPVTQPATPPADKAAKPETQANAAQIPGQMSDDAIAELEEFSPHLAAMAKSSNQVLQAVLGPQGELAKLRSTVQRMQNDHEWATVQPIVRAFLADQVKQGNPEIPEADLRSFAEEAALYLDAKNAQIEKAGGNQFLTPQQAMQAMFLVKAGKQIQDNAATAKKQGRQEVVKSLEKRAKLFDLGAGGPGKASGSTRGSNDPRAGIRNAVRQYQNSLKSGS